MRPADVFVPVQVPVHLYDAGHAVFVTLPEQFVEHFCVDPVQLIGVVATEIAQVPLHVPEQEVLSAERVVLHDPLHVPEHAAALALVVQVPVQVPVEHVPLVRLTEHEPRQSELPQEAPETELEQRSE